ncbi:MAG: hypothetical protein J6X42_01430, partial [Alphaproteobacteria bacterium]|nr:hypothetical protein [Alphaproteobacteria bacterium]
RAGDAEQYLILKAGIETIHQFFDGIRLVTRRLKRAFDFELMFNHKAHYNVFVFKIKVNFR